MKTRSLCMAAMMVTFALAAAGCAEPEEAETGRPAPDQVPVQDQPPAAPGEPAPPAVDPDEAPPVPDSTPVVTPEPPPETPQPPLDDEPDATPVAAEPTWPQEGSHATYRVQSYDGAPDASWSVNVDLTVDWVFREGAWQSACAGIVSTRHATGEEELRFDNQTIDRELDHGPPMGPTDAHVGEVVSVQLLWSCDLSEQERRVNEDLDGQYQAHELQPYAAFDATWHQDTGLVLEWDDQRRNSRSWGELQSTDAPI